MQPSIVPERIRRCEFPYLREMPAHLLRPENRYLKTLLTDISSQTRPNSPNLNVQIKIHFPVLIGHLFMRGTSLIPE
ncbi:hypothetical protein GQ44DRAFT_443213 [Phaeosphaeriaceae sp. PMI808]|nr:hypothetical protein GQ44DRAFT_443213 [Phaeosphaeriaceae sp. PMI808]